MYYHNMGTILPDVDFATNPGLGAVPRRRVRRPVRRPIHRARAPKAHKQYASAIGPSFEPSAPVTDYSTYSGPLTPSFAASGAAQPAADTGFLANLFSAWSNRPAVLKKIRFRIKPHRVMAQAAALIPEGKAVQATQLLQDAGVSTTALTPAGEVAVTPTAVKGVYAAERIEQAGGNLIERAKSLFTGGGAGVDRGADFGEFPSAAGEGPNWPAIGISAAVIVGGVLLVRARKS